MKHKFNWRFWFFVILFGGIQPLGYRGLYYFWNDVVNHGTFMEGTLYIVVFILLCFILFVYLLTTINLLRTYIKNKGCGLMITENGIENTVIIVKLFALFLVVPIRCIPWEAIKYYNKDNNKLYIRVNRKDVDAGFMGRLIISVLGYQFCSGLVKPEVRPEDIEKYEYRFQCL